MNNNNIIHTATHDVQDIEHSWENSEMCLRCVFSDRTTARGCFLLLTNTATSETTTVTISRAQTTEHCFGSMERGIYLIVAYDWEQNGQTGPDPAITTHIHLIPIPTRFSKSI